MQAPQRVKLFIGKTSLSFLKRFFLDQMGC